MLIISCCVWKHADVPPFCLMTR